ncbi:uncharacterized protein LACBIDRAFT_308521 [Laccaria bicolor S238N-H82]|uniref:Predicted protein n=1 Tax=Laccaria bicolor (strain S238N-H82 / ATCC MYA-4686) TaxID=486041 RepID=B0CWJ7_LACBS|nr:uncharacterized protein LACBIDRAFT_308521 [Laccaria bicolor S238N-H82]EDR13521.1 predicted protein [Laccaria bicolor S238N-H82]|eukprot:XP_001876019.1 predicted protein [Laccaria bicolor S238N-H82]
MEQGRCSSLLSAPQTYGRLVRSNPHCRAIPALWRPQKSSGLRSYTRLLPLSDGACPIVRRSTANPSLINSKRSTSPRALPVYQRELCLEVVACYVARKLVSLPSLMAVRQSIIPPPTQASRVQIVARCLAAVGLSKGNSKLEELHRPVER